MPTDIHLYVETYSPTTGHWTIPTEPDPYYIPPEQRLAEARTWHHYESYTLPDMLAHLVHPKPARSEPHPYTEQEAQEAAADPDNWEGAPTRLVRGYSDQNYGLFAILADVRNGRTAGVEIGEPTPPLDNPRGIPIDASEQYRWEVQRWGRDGHSHTWFTLPELLRYPWAEREVVNSRMAHPRGGWHTKGLPELPPDFDFDAFAIELELVLNVEGQRAALERWPGLGFAGSVDGGNAAEWRRVKWKVTHQQQAGEGWIEYLDDLKAQAEAAGQPLEFTRLVMFFDC